VVAEVVFSWDWRKNICDRRETQELERLQELCSNYAFREGADKWKDFE